MVKNNYIYNKKILEYCPNFDKIVDCDFFEEDTITKKLIKIYEEFIFNVDLNNKEDVAKLTQIDELLKKYLDDYHFRGELRSALLEIKVSSEVQNIIAFVVNKLIEIFKGYKEGYTRNIYIPRWV